MPVAGRGSAAVGWLRRCAGALAISAVLAPAAWASFAYIGQGRLEILADQVSWRLDDGGPADVQSLLSDEAGWKSQGRDPLALGREPVAIWSRFQLPASPVGSAVLVSSAPWERIDYYVVRDGMVVAHEVAGTLVPFAEHSSPLLGAAAFMRPGFVSVQLQAQRPTTVVARMQTHQRYVAVWALGFSIWDPAATSLAERSDRFVQGLFYGLMLFLLLYNFCLFLVTREASYLYYVVMEMGMTTTSAILFGQSFEFLWPEHPSWDHYGSWMAAGVAGFGMGQFLRHYLDTKRHFPKTDRALRWYAVFALVMVPVPLVTSMTTDVAAAILFGSTPLTVVLIASVVLNAYRRHHPLAGNLLAAMACLCASFLLYVATFMELVPIHFVTVHAAQIGSAVMGIILSLGIGIRMQRMHDELAQHEREQLVLAETQKLELERQVAERTSELESAREKSELLLENILPRPIIDELAANGTVEPRRHEEATILFTDFAGFTGTVATIPARRLVQELDEIFRAFDEIVAGFGLEKIKTIGDAYMAASGLPLAAEDHAQRCVAAGVALCRYIEQRNDSAALKWGLRVGVHSGAVVAGVVGKHKYAYDVWGDTVNIASRLESAGEAGKVNISAYTYELVRDSFDCDYRGKVAAKGKGEIDMYFIVAPRPVAAVPA